LGINIPGDSQSSPRFLVSRNRGTAAGIAQILFYIFIAIFIISLILGSVRGTRGP
jgi:hypothetical protein